MAIAAAEAAAVKHVVFNQREASFLDMLLEFRDGRWTGSLWAQETMWPLEQFTGIYTRLIDQAIVPEHQTRGSQMPQPEAVGRSTALISILAEWIEMAKCRVLNKAGAMASNGSKPYQLQWIQRAGFLTPPTLVTNDPSLALEFARQHKRVIYKSTSGVRSIVRELNPSDYAHLARLRSLPTQFQALIVGTNIRVHVVGEKLFATEILSPAVDYRYAHRDGLEVEMRPVELPSEVAARCVQLSQELHLPFCGIDLMRTSSGDYYCFEVNPSPAYSYFEQEAGQPISRAVVAYLAGRQD
jgi:glutathione synthase/RimK-type ligase-like ATP-grasp enzyme